MEQFIGIVSLTYFVVWTSVLVFCIVHCVKCCDYTYYLAKLGGNMFIGSILLLLLTALDGVACFTGIRWILNM